MGRCSFATVVLNDVFEPRFPFGTNLEAKFLYLEDQGRQWLLGAFDFSGTFRSTAITWRKEIARHTGIPFENIWYHELQTHAAPISYELAGDACQRLCETCAPAILAMMERAEEADLCYLLTDFGGQYNLNREQYVPELGAVTVWAGLEFDKDGRPWSQNPAIMNLDGYRPSLPAFDAPICFDRPTDRQGMLAVFRNSAGVILGTLTRFAAHPDVAVLFESHGITDQYRYHFDWPGYLRQMLESRLGGTCLYLNGQRPLRGSLHQEAPDRHDNL